MKFKLKILCVLTAFLSISCATNYEDEKSVLLSEPETSDLVSSFDITEVASEEFQIKEETKAPEKKAQATKAATTKKTTTAVSATEKKVVEAKAEVPTKGKEASVKLPADYPKEYEGYDKKSQEVWKNFSPRFYKDEQSIIAVTYLGVTAGYITIHSKNVVNMNDHEVFHYYARFKSSDSYRYFYWLDDYIESYVDKKTFLPRKYTLIQREKKQDVDDLQLFDFNKMMTYHWYKRVKEGKTKEEKVEKMIPRYATDSFSALQLVRGMPLNPGDVYEFPVITRGKFWLLRAEVVGEETVTVNGERVKGIKIKAETNFPGVLKKNGDILFWYGADEHRKLLKFQAKVKIGSLNGELVEYRSGTKVE